MDLDTLYRVPQDLIFRHLKQDIRHNSLDLAVLCACEDPYISRKTVYNTMPLINRRGIILAKTTYEGISDLLKISDYSKVIIEQETANPFVAICNGEYNLDATVVNKNVVDNYVETMSPNANILFAGDRVALHAIRAKQMCNSVMVYCDNHMFCVKLKNEGLKEVWT